MNRLVVTVKILGAIFATSSVISGITMAFMSCTNYVADLGEVKSANRLLGIIGLFVSIISVLFFIIVIWKPNTSWLIWLCCALLIICVIGNTIILMKYFTTLNVNAHKLAMDRIKLEFDKPDTKFAMQMYAKYQCCGIKSAYGYAKQESDIPSACYGKRKILYEEGCENVLTKNFRTHQVGMQTIISINILFEILVCVCGVILGTIFPKHLEDQFVCEE